MPTARRCWRSLRATAARRWSSTVMISTITDHIVAGNLRTSSLPSAAVDASGRVYVVWQDCRFRMNCSSNDIVMSTSSDGSNWTAPAGIPIDAVTSTVDHFIPALAADPATSGGSAHLALTYNFYPQTACTSATCQLEVGSCRLRWRQHLERSDHAGRADAAGLAAQHVVGRNGGRLHGDRVFERSGLWSVCGRSGEFRQCLQRSDFCHHESAAADQAITAHGDTRRRRRDPALRSSTAQGSSIWTTNIPSRKGRSSADLFIRTPRMKGATRWLSRLECAKS